MSCSLQLVSAWYDLMTIVMNCETMSTLCGTVQGVLKYVFIFPVYESNPSKLKIK